MTSARMPLSELGHPSEHERHGIGSVGLHRSTFSLSSRTQGSGWLLAFSRRRLDRGHCCEPDATVSHGLALSLRVSHLWAPSMSVWSEDRQANKDPLMRFLAPSAHQAGRIYLRGNPNPLRSAFVVGSTLTVCPPPDPAGLFHPAALMGFLTTATLQTVPKDQFVADSSLHSLAAPCLPTTTEVTAGRAP